MAYCTADEVKTYTGITKEDLGFSTDTDLDNFISTLISQAEEIINDYCGRDFNLHENVVEKHDAEAENYEYSDAFPRSKVAYLIFPKHYPIVSVSSLKIDDQTVDTDDYKVYDSYIKSKTIPKEKWQNIELTYSYGYSSVPQSVKTVCIRLVAKMLNKAIQIRGGRGAESLSVGDFSVKYNYSEGLDPELQAMLNKYKKVGLVIS